MPTPKYEIGDAFTIDGFEEVKLNPDREWWHFWKPKLIKTGKLTEFRIVGHSTGCSPLVEE